MPYPPVSGMLVSKQLFTEPVMAEIINLKQQRKTKARKDKEKKAVENRQKFGRTKAEKQTEKLKTKLAERHLEGHKLEKEQE